MAGALDLEAIVAGRSGALPGDDSVPAQAVHLVGHAGARGSRSVWCCPCGPASPGHRPRPARGSETRASRGVARSTNARWGRTRAARRSKAPGGGSRLADTIRSGFAVRSRRPFASVTLGRPLRACLGTTTSTRWARTTAGVAGHGARRSAELDPPHRAEVATGDRDPAAHRRRAQVGAALQAAQRPGVRRAGGPTQREPPARRRGGTRLRGRRSRGEGVRSGASG